jgi:hypothetical protein
LAYKIQTPGNYPEESIQQGKDDLQSVDQEMGGTLLVAQLVEVLRHKPEGRGFDSL